MCEVITGNITICGITLESLSTASVSKWLSVSLLLAMLATVATTASGSQNKVLVRRRGSKNPFSLVCMVPIQYVFASFRFLLHARSPNAFENSLSIISNYYLSAN